VISRRSKTFRELYARLPVRVRELTVKNFRLWRANPAHPSLHFKPLAEPDWSVRVGAHYRAIGARAAGFWFFNFPKKSAALRAIR
jgi:hypothetical protein